MKKFIRLAMVAFVAMAAIATMYVGVRAATAGVEFTLTNLGANALRSVTVQVTGRSYGLGDIPPGASKTVKLNPTSESHIELRLATGRNLTIDCYIEPQYRGRINATVTSTAVVAVTDDVRAASFF